jgi:hypothetical protein
MKRLTVLVLFAASCAGCGSSMDTSPVLQPGAFNERFVDDRGIERIGVDFVADVRGDERRRGN